MIHFYIFPVADLPGLIEGSHQNRGLGISFLRHIERCTALILLVDISGPEPWRDVDMLRHELSCFSEELVKRPQLIVANKMDMPGSKVGSLNNSGCCLNGFS